MKTLKVLVVKTTESQLVENLLNKFRINLNDWDRTKELQLNGQSVVVYNIVCDDDSYTSIKDIIKESRN